MLIVLQSEPPGPLVDKAWELVEETYRYRQCLLDKTIDLYKKVWKLTLKSWEAYKLNRSSHGLGDCTTPQIIKQLLRLTAEEFGGDASGGRQSNEAKGIQRQADNNSTNQGDHDGANKGLMSSLDNSSVSSPYFDFESMPPGWDLISGSDVSNLEYWDCLLKEYNPGQWAG